MEDIAGARAVRANDWWHRRGLLPLADRDRVRNAFMSVLARIPEEHFNVFLKVAPSVISLPPDWVAAIVPAGRSPLKAGSQAPLIVLNTLLWQDEEALEYTAALQVARLTASSVEAATLGEPHEVIHLVGTWGFRIPASVYARGCRLAIEPVPQQPGVVATGLQPHSDDDVEAFRPDLARMTEWTNRPVELGMALRSRATPTT